MLRRLSNPSNPNLDWWSSWLASQCVKAPERYV